MKLHGLGYAGFTAADPAAWLGFATDVIGMMPARSLPGEERGAPGSIPPSAGSGTAPDGSVYLKMDDRQWRVAVHPGEGPGIAYLGFEVTDAAALRDAVDELAGRGLDVTTGSPEDAAARGVTGLASCADPSGNRIELYHGAQVDLEFRSPLGTEFLTGDLGMGHVLLFVGDLEASLDFYVDTLGFQRSDYIPIGPGMSIQFLRCTPRHHSVGLAHFGPFNGIHHVMFETTSIDDVGCSFDRAVDAGLPITKTIGRHVNDRMVSFYTTSPGGFDVEIGWDGVLCGDDWVDRAVIGREPWGHRGFGLKELEDLGGQDND